MSDYVHNKAVFYPLDNSEIKEKLNIDDFWDMEMDERFKQYFHPSSQINKFDIECTDRAYYLIYLLYCTYGEECADFGRSRELTYNEKIKYKDIFEKIIPQIDETKLKYVDYCYYNCCEPRDYYLTDPENDDFYREI